MATAIERFERHYIPEPNSGCWLWTGSISRLGYARFSPQGKPVLAHRFSYQAFNGQIREGLEIDHLCRLRCCVNPEHLVQVTHLENVQRGWPAKATCKQGHAWTEANTYRCDGRRYCRACIKLHRNRRRDTNV